MTDKEMNKLAEQWTNLEKAYPGLHRSPGWVMETALQEKIVELEKENAELQQKYLEESFEKAKLVKKQKEALANNYK